MKKSGFTLIELLAVIVILAIIAVITVPMVAEQIESSRKGGAIDSFYGTIQATELSWVKGLQETEPLTSSICRFGVDGEDVFCEGNFTVKTSGEMPSEGAIHLSSSGSAYVYVDDSLKFGNYYCCGEGTDVYCKQGSKPTVADSNGVCQKALATGQPAKEQLLDTVIQEGDGLYKTVPEENATEVEQTIGQSLEYLYKGLNPNNYLTFNGEVSGWRIMGITKDGYLKIRKNTSIGEMAWDFDVEGDGASSHDWPQASLNSYLNGTYYSEMTSSAKNLIVKHNFEYGRVVENNTDLISQLNSEKASKDSQFVGLMTVSDYIIAGTNTEKCGNLDLINKSPAACKNYLASTISLWTLNGVYTSTSQSTVRSFYVGAGGEIKPWGKHNLEGVTPVVYLKSNITLTGRGTKADPFLIKPI